MRRIYPTPPPACPPTATRSSLLLGCHSFGHAASWCCTPGRNVFSEQSPWPSTHRGNMPPPPGLGRYGQSSCCPAHRLKKEGLMTAKADGSWSSPLLIGCPCGGRDAGLGLVCTGSGKGSDKTAVKTCHAKPHKIRSRPPNPPLSACFFEMVPVCLPTAVVCLVLSPCSGGRPRRGPWG